MRHTAAVVILFGIFGGILPSFAEETWLNYRIATQVERELGNVGGEYKELSNLKPAGGVELPPVVAAKPWFGEVLDARCVVVDKSRADSQVWDVLWLDVNGNKKLEPNERFELKSEERSWRRALVPVEFKAEDGPRVQHFQVSIYQREGLVPSPEAKDSSSRRMEEPKLLMGVRSAGYYFGKVKFGEKSHLVALVDANANGAFNDPVAGNREGDWILVDQNDEGNFGPDYRYPEKLAYVGKYLYVDAIYWGVSVARDGSTIGITRPQIATGRLQIDEPSVKITVIGENGKFVLKRTKAEEAFILPVGNYRVQAVEVTQIAEEGKGKKPSLVPRPAVPDDMRGTWTIKSMASRGEAPPGRPFLITQDALATMKVGSPLKARVTPYRAAKELRFDLVLQGQDGLSYQILREGQSPEDTPPMLKLRTKKGDWEKKYAFHFG